MRRPIDKLDNMEAVYSLYRLTSNYASGLDLNDPPSVRKFVEDCAREALGVSRAGDFMEFFESEEWAADLSRACLAAVESDAGLIQGTATQLDAILENPPKTRQADLGIGLELLSLAGMAMFLMGSLNIETKNMKIQYKGNDKVAEIFKAVLNKLPGWKTE